MSASQEDLRSSAAASVSSEAADGHEREEDPVREMVDVGEEDSSDVGSGSDSSEDSQDMWLQQDQTLAEGEDQQRSYNLAVETFGFGGVKKEHLKCELTREKNRLTLMNERVSRIVPEIDSSASDLMNIEHLECLLM